MEQWWQTWTLTPLDGGGVALSQGGARKVASHTDRTDTTATAVRDSSKTAGTAHERHSADDRKTTAPAGRILALWAVIMAALLSIGHLLVKHKK